jgi:hypothetical protein
MSTKQRPLTGPKCRCGGIPRRRRSWMRWDRTRCPKCGTVYEMVDVTRMEFIGHAINRKVAKKARE